MELASLGPANLIFGFAQYAFASLQIATLSLIGQRLRDDNVMGAERILSVALLVGLAGGLAASVFMEVLAPRLVAMTGAATELIAPATLYVRIRAIAQPAVLTIMVCQSALLAQKDSVTPLVTVLLSTAVSLLGNLVAVAWLGLGLGGAAWTTVATQLVGAAALFAALGSKGKLRPRLERPRREEFLLLMRTIGPLSVTYLSKNLCYIYIQSLAACLDTVRLAAHQAIYAVWNLCSFTSAPLEQAALTFLPSARAPWQQRRSGQILMSLGVLDGVLCGLITAGLPSTFPHWFTKDPAVWPYISTVALPALASMLIVGTDVAATGILMARRDMNYVARSYIITLAALSGYNVACRHYGWGLPGVWWALVFFFGVRAVQSLSRLFLGPRQQPAVVAT